MLVGGGTINLLRSLLLDSTAPMLQNSAAVSLGKIASYSEEFAASIVQNDLLSQLVYLMQEQSVTNNNSNLLTKTRNILKRVLHICCGQ